MCQYGAGDVDVYPAVSIVFIVFIMTVYRAIRVRRKMTNAQQIPNIGDILCENVSTITICIKLISLYSIDVLKPTQCIYAPHSIFRIKKRLNNGLIHHSKGFLGPFKPSRCIKASFYIPENRLNFSTTRGFRMKISMKLVYQYMTIFLNFLIHYKSRIATAIRGL